ncbi:MAG: glycosyltransferase [Gemmatimonadaceae bacterium]
MLTTPSLFRAIVFALPWIAAPIRAVFRQRGTKSLDDYSEVPAEPIARVSVILPARNEAAHIAECVASLRETTWPDVEITVIDDHSTDGTGMLARKAAGHDKRIRVIDAPDLPAGWFGKQWACHAGAQMASGQLLLFTDADTRHAPDLIARMVRARAERDASLISVAGTQIMNSFWEHAIQPAVFAILMARFGGTKQLEAAKRSTDVIANGQCLMFVRDAYEAIGGHESVRGTVAEDLMLAQRTHAHGFRVSLVLGTNQLSTHMYDGLGAIVRGWMKNVYAGGRMAMWGGKFGRLLFPFALVGAPLTMIAPFLGGSYVAVTGALGHSVSVTLALWSALGSTGMLWFFSRANTFARESTWRVLLVPLGMLVFAGICVGAVIRGQTVEWKGRTYRAA